MDFPKVFFYLLAIVIASVSLVGAENTQHMANLQGLNRFFKCRRNERDVRVKRLEEIRKFDQCNIELNNLKKTSDNLHRTLAQLNSLIQECEIGEFAVNRVGGNVTWPMTSEACGQLKNCLEDTAGVVSTTEQRELETLACKWTAVSLKDLNDYTQQLVDAAAIKQEDCTARKNNYIVVP